MKKKIQMNYMVHLFNMRRKINENEEDDELGEFEKEDNEIDEKQVDEEEVDMTAIILP